MVGLAQALERLGRLSEALGPPRRPSRPAASAETGRPSGSRSSRRRGPLRSSVTSIAPAPRPRRPCAAGLLDESVLTLATQAHVGVIWLEIGEPARCFEQLRASASPTSPRSSRDGAAGSTPCSPAPSWRPAHRPRQRLAGAPRRRWRARAPARRGVGAPRTALLSLAEGDAAGAASSRRARPSGPTPSRAGPGRALSDAGREASRRRATTRVAGAADPPSASSRSATPPLPRRGCAPAPPARPPGPRAAPALPAREGASHAQRSRARDRRACRARMHQP